MNAIRARILLMNECCRSSFAYLYIVIGTKDGCVLRRMTKVLRSRSVDSSI